MKKSFKHCMVSFSEKLGELRAMKLDFLNVPFLIFAVLLTICPAEFESAANAEKVLTQELEDMLLYIAKTGRVL